MTAAKCPACHAEQAEWILCKRCAATLLVDLHALPEWLRYLDDAMARDVQTGSGNGKSKSAETPLPYDERASKARAYIRNQLATWAHELGAGESVADNPRAWCAYLVRSIDVIRGHEASDEILTEIAYCLEIARKAVDSPPSQVYLGPCQGRVDDEGNVDDERAPCATQLYAREKDATYECPVCHVVVDVSKRRDEMLALLEHQWATLRVCSNVLAVFGLDIKQDTVKSWTKPHREGAEPRLKSTGKDQDGAKLYRVGDVAVLAQRMLDRKTRKRAS